MIEEFKQVVGFDNYLIYADGRVYSKGRIRNGGKFYKGKFLKPHLTRCGYHTVVLYDVNKVATPFPLHRVLATHYIPNPLNKTQVNHINGVKTDNNIENLEWVTPSENILHAHRTGLARAWNKGILKYENKECHCGKSFYPLKKTQLTCSKTCAQKLQRIIKWKKYLITIPQD